MGWREPTYSAYLIHRILILTKDSPYFFSRLLVAQPEPDDRLERIGRCQTMTKAKELVVNVHVNVNVHAPSDILAF